MAERYVRPPLVAREPTAAWLVLWRFRLVALVLIALVVLLGFRAFQHLSGASDQDPGVGAAAVVVSPLG